MHTIQYHGLYGTQVMYILVDGGGGESITEVEVQGRTANHKFKKGHPVNC